MAEHRPCPARSSVTGQPCLLEDGHPPSSSVRYHRFAERDPRTLTGATVPEGEGSAHRAGVFLPKQFVAMQVELIADRPDTAQTAGTVRVLLQHVTDLVASINRLIAARQSAPWEAGTPEHAEWVAAEVEARARVAAAGGCAAATAEDAGEHDHLCPCERFVVEVVPGPEVSDG